MNTIENLKKKIKNIVENYDEDLIRGYITGDGPIPCDILFVGEAPGKTEVEQGKAFVGTAGKNFEKHLNSIGLSRENIRVTNTCYFRPIKIKEGKTGKTSISNRPPKISEIELFREILDEEIKLVHPKIIITLGNVPLRRLTNFKSIGEYHGTLHFNQELSSYIFPMYHPSSLTYNRSEEFNLMYKEDWNKLKKALENL
ncbi:uracil-DNA glycosylase [Clostridium sp. CX1]|uniref:Uracil-DNA glycosylase n=1 Tax=Clostridium tanneri TaxID=3037988 RepID=A0ABU4JYC5_9CLOT|nr:MULTISPECIES: uracil-DNA glycosylase [unclassified Clostridium]MCT8978852.1 uracil-DNA glycosylase [Clostridium sp. CX1]MDW8803164.1 uracil-DNA glycosylase [Clostridium sp. A1-XYC3]